MIVTPQSRALSASSLPVRSRPPLYATALRRPSPEGFNSWRHKVFRKLMLVAATFAVPAVLAAQDVPNAHASDTVKAKVAAHRQNPQVPAQEASDTAKSKVAQHRASTVRGSALGTDNRPVTPAVPA